MHTNIDAGMGYGPTLQQKFESKMQMTIEPATVAALIAAGGLVIGGAMDYFSESSQDESNEKISADELAWSKEKFGQEFGETKEENQRQEHQRGFKRLIDVMGTGNTLANQASGSARLRSVRNAGQSRQIQP